jgi:hypothetical protein
MKKLFLFLMVFGIIFVGHVANVNALAGWTYYETSSYGPDTEDFEVEVWVSDGPYGVEGYWYFDIQFELENEASLERIYVVPDGWFTIDMYLQNYDGSGYQDWYSITVAKHWNDMDITCLMIFYGEDEGDEWVIDVSDEAYGVMDEGWVFENVHLLYPAENKVYRIDFVFEVDFYIVWPYGLNEFEEIADVALQYELELYYNPSAIYQGGYDEGYDDGFREGFWDGYDEGYEFGQDPETRGFSAMLIALWGAISSFLGITLFWDITIGAIVLIPIVFGLIAFILGKRGD